MYELAQGAYTFVIFLTITDNLKVNNFNTVWKWGSFIIVTFCMEHIEAK